MLEFLLSYLESDYDGSSTEYIVQLMGAKLATSKIGMQILRWQKPHGVTSKAHFCIEILMDFVPEIQTS